jgi:hypothetical protein
LLALDAGLPIDGGQIMVGDGEVLFRPRALAPFKPQLVEGQKGLAFVDVVEIGVEEILALR